MPQLHATVQMFRKPSNADTAASKRNGHVLPTATSLGSFQVKYVGIDKTKDVVRHEAASRLHVAPSSLLVNVGPAEMKRGVQHHLFMVYAPATDEKGAV